MEKIFVKARVCTRRFSSHRVAYRKRATEKVQIVLMRERYFYFVYVVSMKKR